MHRAFPIIALLLAGTSAGSARILNAADGRTIDAEVLGFDGLEKVRIKRTDTGQTFTLPVSSFAETDQKALREEAAAAAARPAGLRDGDVVIEISRLRFDSRKTKQDVPLTNNEVIKDALVTTDEDWGFTITLKNTTHKAVENLRSEYILYTKVDELKNTGREPRIRHKAFSLSFDVLPPNGRISAKTSTVTTRKEELRKGVIWTTTTDTATRDTLHGIWLRIYQGDTVVLETASPTTLPREYKWTDPSD